MNIGIGPTNAAGQGYLLAKALRNAGIAAESFGLTTQHAPPLVFPVDRPLTRKEWGTPRWKAYVAGFSHLLFWNGLSPFGPYRWWDDETDQPAPMAAVFRGGELRDPTRHQSTERWSPFGQDELTDRLTRRHAVLRERLERSPIRSFVATVGLLDDLPDATWLPIIAEPVPQRRLLERRPVVLHVPTNGQLKGAGYVDALGLDSVDVRRPALMTPADTLAAIAGCDVLIGGLVLGDYGGTEIQAMAAGRVVVGNVSRRVRGRLPASVPIVQATPATLQRVLLDIVARPDHYREIAAKGPAYAAEFHDGRYSVAQVRDFLGAEAVAA